MKRSETSKVNVLSKWKMLSSSTDLVFALYGGMQRGGVENPASLLSGNSRSQASPESLQNLGKAGLIESIDGKWELSQVVFDFLEGLSGVGGEVNVKTIIGNRETLETHLEHYLRARGEGEGGRYLIQIRKSLRSILSNIKRTLNAIDYSIRDTYVSEPDLALKVDILKENLSKLDELEGAVRGVGTGLVSFLDSAFSDAEGEGGEDGNGPLSALNVWFQSQLASFYPAKRSRVAQQLREYLDRIERIDKPARKIEQIFRLWSNNMLESNSNFSQHEKAYRPRVRKPSTLALSLEKDLYEDDNRNIEIAMRGMRIGEGVEPDYAEGVPRSQILRRAPSEVSYNIFEDIRKVFTDFSKAEGDPLLSDYVLSYSGFIREHSFEERIGIFLEVANQYRRSLVTDEGYSVHSSQGSAFRCKRIKFNRSLPKKVPGHIISANG
ncbi:MAG: hypothetical protein IJ202_10125 [Bacteroidales bacterium]|nr:hypothetical protein [Bacteroidales bacterium]